jgi:hypothetical protein
MFLLLIQLLYLNISKTTIVQKTILVTNVTQALNKYGEPVNLVSVKWDYTHKVNDKDKDKLVIGKYCKVEITDKVITDVFYCSDTDPMNLDKATE